MVIMTMMSGCVQNRQEKPVVGIAWSNRQDSYSFISTLKAVEAAGGIPRILEPVRSDDLEYDENGKLINSQDEKGMLTREAADLIEKNGYIHSDVERIMEGIDCLILPGGGDLSPNLYKEPQESHTIEGDLEYCAQRDVSDYLLAQYCLEKNIPLLGICRGMQVLSVVSGARMIQDIGTWFSELGLEYHYLHRRKQKDEFTPHDVIITDRDSLLYRLMKKDVINNCPSWHHQAVESLEGTDLSMTAYTETEGVNMIEAVERKDKAFVIGVQYHPEAAVRKILEKEDNAGNYMPYEEAIALFKGLIEEAEKSKDRVHK